jgi:ribonuclease HI
MEKIPAKPRNPAHRGKLPFATSIPPSKEASIDEECSAREEIRLYSDGSAIEGKVGAAAVLLRPGKLHRVLHYHLGPESEHTVPEAELIGIILALHLIKSERPKGNSYTIGIDNQAAIKAFQSDLRNPAHNAAREIIRLGTMLKKTTRQKNYLLVLRWTAGHVGISGNELADREAKKTAAGLSFNKKLLPTYLRHPLTVNPSAVRQKIIMEIKQCWKNKWRNSKRGQIASSIDHKTPSAHFLHMISNANITRRSASLITQLFITHIPLNEYLKRFKIADSARCPACGASLETVKHYLLECSGYAHERWALDKRLKKKHKRLTLENLLGDVDLTVPLANFISASHRFT